MAENENQGPPVNNGNEVNQALAKIQSNVFASTPAREAAFKKLPGAAPTKLSDTARERVETALVKAFYPTWKAANGGVGTVKACFAFLRTQLQSTGALVSGGFVLRALGAFEFPILENTRERETLYGQIHYSDIDIYVSCENLQKLVPLITAFKPTLYQNRQASLYCNSFLRRNKIRKVYSYHRQELKDGMGFPVFGLYGKLVHLKKTGNKEAIAQELLTLEGKTPGLVNSIDIMAVRNKKSPVDVVQNFDLTFCQVWYDGKDVWATHPEHIVERVGYLQGDYVKLFLGKNQFLENRLKKYTARGFEIRFDPKMLDQIGNSVDFVQLVCKEEVSPRTLDHYKLWAMHTLLQFIVSKSLEDKTEDVKNKPWGRLEPIPSEGGVYTISKTFTPTDGYDSEDFEFEKKEPLFEIANKYAQEHDTDLEDLTPEEKFYQLASRCLSALYTINPNKSLYLEYSTTPLRSEQLVHKLLNSPHIKPYIDALREGVKREGTDIMYREDGQLFDFHAHRLDRAVGLEFLDRYLGNNKNIPNKDELPCYLPKEECGKYLTRDDIRPFATLSEYKEYVTTRPPKQMIPLGTLTDFGSILRNVPKVTDGWGVINKQTMCPFCLRGEERANGCAYMTHESLGAYDRKKMPYCANSEQVKALWNKYKVYQSLLPRDGYGDQGLEWCAICGAPCHGHRHFDSQNPGQLKAGIPAAGGVDDYGKCPGGGRPEMIARMLAVRDVMLVHKDDAEPNNEAIRKKAAFAADAAPRDPALMARAAAIFAQEAATRRFNNVGLNEYSMAPVAAAPLVDNNGNNSPPPAGPAGEEAPGGEEAPALAEALDGGSKGTRKRKSSLKKRSRTFKRKSA